MVNPFFLNGKQEKKKGGKKGFRCYLLQKKQHPASLESFNTVKTGRPKCNIKPLIHLAGPILYPSQFFFNITVYNTSIHGNLGAKDSKYYNACPRLICFTITENTVRKGRQEAKVKILWVRVTRKIN